MKKLYLKPKSEIVEMHTCSICELSGTKELGIKKEDDSGFKVEDIY